jgi:hypothetical protein
MSSCRSTNLYFSLFTLSLKPIIVLKFLHYEIIVSLFTWHLGGDTEGVRQLRLSSPELTEGLRDGHRVDPAAQHLVQLLTSGRQTENVATIDRGLKWKIENY